MYCVPRREEILVSEPTVHQFTKLNSSAPWKFISLKDIHGFLVYLFFKKIEIKVLKFCVIEILLKAEEKT